TLAHKLASLVDSGLGDAKRLARDPDSPGVERAHGDGETLPFRAEAVPGGDPRVLEHHLTRGRPVQSHLVEQLADAHRGCFRRHRRFRSSSRHSRAASVATLVCASTFTAVEAHARASSSMQVATARASRPAPPYSRGMSTPMSPDSAAPWTASRGKRWSRSTS